MWGWISFIVFLFQKLDLPTFSCPSEGKWLGNECFAIYWDKLNWNDARQSCIDKGGDLAAPKDSLKFVKWLDTWLDYPPGDEIVRFKTAPWVGAKYGDKFITHYKLAITTLEKKNIFLTRNFQWINEEHLSLDDESWEPGRPKKFKGHCIAVYSDDFSQQYRLFDSKCTEKLTYICEF